MINKIINTSFIVIFLIALTLYAQEEDKPNILWITSEDNNVTWVGAYNNPHVHTPFIDQLSSEGFRYTEAYANAPVCAPSRSTWITGLYAISMGTHHMRSRNVIPHNQILYYPDILKAHGYYVSNANKTDYNIGGREDKDCWDNPNNLEWHVLKNKQPFFQVVNFYESHESRIQGSVDDIIYDPSQTKLKSYHPDLPIIRRNYAKYHDALTRMDARVGDILKGLKDAGLDQNTIVIYTSDHGGVLPRSKRYLYNSGLHCPLVIRIPETFQEYWPASTPGSTVDRLVSFIDMPKTWLALTGAEIPNTLQGRIFLGNQQEEEADYHFAFRGRMDERIDNARAVHNKRYLYIRNYVPYAPLVQHLEYQWKIKAQVAWEEHVKKGLASPIQARPFMPKVWTEELYDMKLDPDCVHNLIEDAQYQNIIQELRVALRNWQLDIFDAGLLPESEMINLADKNKITIFEMVRNPRLYPLIDLLNMVDLALEKKKENRSTFYKSLSDPHIGIRYWSAIGLLLINDYSQSSFLVKDDSDEIRAIGAWMMVQNNQSQKGIYILNEMLHQYSYASLSILNILDWINEPTKPSWLNIKTLNYEAGKDLDKIRNYILKKWSNR